MVEQIEGNVPYIQYFGGMEKTPWNEYISKGWRIPNETERNGFDRPGLMAILFLNASQAPQQRPFPAFALRGPFPLNKTTGIRIPDNSGPDSRVF